MNLIVSNSDNLTNLKTFYCKPAVNYYWARGFLVFWKANFVELEKWGAAVRYTFIWPLCIVILVYSSWFFILMRIYSITTFCSFIVSSSSLLWSHWKFSRCSLSVESLKWGKSQNYRMSCFLKSRSRVLTWESTGHTSTRTKF